MKESITRRNFMKTSVTAAVVLPTMTAGNALADNHEKRIEETNPQAQALGYKHNAEEVDTSRFPRRASAEGKQQLCNNCQFYIGDTSAEWAPCSLFANKYVKGSGWCNAWAKKLG